MAAPLDQLREACLALLFSTQAHSVGFGELRTIRLGSLDRLLNGREQKLLAMYDRVGEMTLEKIAREEASSEERQNEQLTEEERERLQKELLTAKANRQLKDTVVEATTVVHPILRAIHPDEKTATNERDLLPCIQERDTLALIHAKLSNQIVSKLKLLSALEAECVSLQDESRKLTGGIVERTSTRVEPDSREYKALKEQLGVEKRRWEIVRMVMQGIVAASGRDWARDKELREVVLECGEEV